MNNNPLLALEKNKPATFSPRMVSFRNLNGLNPLISAALPLLLLMIKLKQTPVGPRRMNELRRQMVAETNAFVERAKVLQCTPRLILAARYCLCTALDETILATTWGGQSDWAQQTLLSIVQKETWGGERFFIILEEMAKSPRENLPLLELIYLILSLGFEGKYYAQEQAIRDEIRQRLFYLITVQRDEPNKQLSPSLKNLATPKMSINHYPSSWKVAGIALALLVGLGIIFNVATYLSGRSVLQELTRFDQAMPIPASYEPAATDNLALPARTAPPPDPHPLHKHHLTRHSPARSA